MRILGAPRTRPRPPQHYGSAAPALLAYAHRIAGEFQEQTIPESRRQWFRENTTLRAFYEQFLLRDRQAKVAAGTLSRGTVEKDRQALNRWERCTRPDDWPAGEPWPGLPLGFVTGRYVTMFLKRLRNVLGAATAKSTWNHLRTIFNYAVRVQALEQAPRPDGVQVDPQRTTIFSPEQIEAAYRALAAEPKLQVAFVIALNVGARPVDLFCLHWSGVTLGGPRPLLEFKARKTGKLQGIPLAPVTVAQCGRMWRARLSSGASGGEHTQAAALRLRAPPRARLHPDGRRPVPERRLDSRGHQRLGTDADPPQQLMLALRSHNPP